MNPFLKADRDSDRLIYPSGSADVFPISAKAKVKENYLLMKIENSYNGCLNIRDGRYHSTKDEKTRGIGMQNIKKSWKLTEAL